MYRIKKYIELLEDEIYDMIERDIEDDDLSLDDQEMLHILMENRKHACELLHEKEMHQTGLNVAAGQVVR